VGGVSGFVIEGLGLFVAQGEECFEVEDPSAETEYE
jgi:hypothetical protein